LDSAEYEIIHPASLWHQIDAGPTKFPDSVVGEPRIERKQQTIRVDIAEGRTCARLREARPYEVVIWQSELISTSLFG
jgi:hypothetical protein